MWNWSELNLLRHLGWWPSLSNKTRTKTLFKFIGYAIFVWNVIVVFQELIGTVFSFKSGNLQDGLANLVVVVSAFMGIINMATLLINANKISNLIEEIEELNERGMKVLKSNEEINTNHYKFCWFINLLMKVLLIICLHWIVRPFTLAWNGEKTMVAEIAWFPWSMDNWALWGIFNILQSIHLYSFGIGWFVLDGLYVVILEVIIANFGMLKTVLNKLNFKNQNEISFRFCIKYHQDLLKACENANDILLLSLTAHCLSYAVIIFLCVYQLPTLLNNMESAKTMNVTEVVETIILTVFLFCMQCQRVTQKCLDMGNAAYSSNWSEGDIKDKVNILVFIQRTRNPQVFSTLVPTKLATFVSVLIAAFFYYHILQFSEEVENKTTLNIS